MTSIVQWVSDLIYTPTLRPDDDFITKIRKGTITTLLLALGAVGLLGFYVADAIIAKDAATNWGGIAIGAIIVAGLFIVILPVYVYVRVTKSCPNFIINAFTLTLTLMTSAGSLLTMAWPIESPLCLLCVALVLHVPVAPIVAIITLVVSILRGINVGYDGVAMINNRRASPLEKTLCWSGIGALSILVIISILYVFTKEFMNKLSALKRAQDVVRHAAASFAQYDTESAKLLLAEYEQQREHDPEMLLSMRELVSNLEKYRAHLPTYVLPRNVSTSCGDDEGDDDDADIDGCDHLAAAGDRRRKEQRPSRRESEASDAFTAAGSDRKTNPEFGSHTGAAADAHSNSSCSKDEEGFGNAAAAASRQQRRMHSTAAHSQQQLVAHRLRVSATCAMIRMSPLPDGVADVDQFLVSVHRLASKYAATVHSFVGETLIVSWNAAHATFRSEMKSTNFVWELRKVFQGLKQHDPSSTPVFAAGIATGRARAQMAGDEAHRTLVVSLSFTSRLEALLTAARARKGGVFVDFGVSEAVKYDYTVQGEEVLSEDAAQVVSTTTPPLAAMPSDAAQLEYQREKRRDAWYPRLAYEVLDSRSASHDNLNAGRAPRQPHPNHVGGGDSEWLYVVGQEQLDPSTLATKLLASRAAGDHDAVAALQRVLQLSGAVGADSSS